MITWAYFRSVRKLKVDQWMKNRNVKTYDDLVDRLISLGVEPPFFSEVETYFRSPEVQKPVALPEIPAIEISQDALTSLASFDIEVKLETEDIASEVKKKKKKTKENIVESSEVIEND